MQKIAIRRLQRLLKQEHMLLDAQLGYCRKLMVDLEQSPNKLMTRNDMYLIGNIFKEVHSGKEK